MLQNKNRLRRMKDFDILFKEGRFVNEKLVDMKIWKIEPDKYPKRNYSESDLKIGFIVSKKISKSAVKRNKIKRQIREVVRLLLKENRIAEGYMIFVIAKPGILGSSYLDIEKNIVRLFTSAKVLDL